MPNLKEIVDEIDSVFGPGFAESHLDLVAAYIQGHFLSEINLSLDRMGLHNLVGPGGSQYPGALEKIGMELAEIREALQAKIGG